MTPRERRLEACIRKLLETTELNLDDMEDETRESIAEAYDLIERPSVETWVDSL